MLQLQHLRQQFHFNDLRFFSVEQSKTSDQPLDFVFILSSYIAHVSDLEPDETNSKQGCCTLSVNFIFF
jgi:hypothetical protein